MAAVLDCPALLHPGVLHDGPTPRCIHTPGYTDAAAGVAVENENFG